MVSNINLAASEAMANSKNGLRDQIWQKILNLEYLSDRLHPFGVLRGVLLRAIPGGRGQGPHALQNGVHHRLPHLAPSVSLRFVYNIISGNLPKTSNPQDIIRCVVHMYRIPTVLHIRYDHHQH